MTTFEPQENEVLQNLLKTTNPMIELMLDGEKIWVLQGSFAGRKGWEYINHKNFERGISKDDLIGKFLQFLLKENRIKSIEYGERGTVYIVETSGELFSGDDILSVLLEMMQITIRSSDDFSY